MASEHAFGDAQAMLDAARVARLKFVVLRRNTDIPGETSALARAFWLHVPEMGRRMGLNIQEDEGHPPSVKVTDEGLMKLIASDLREARPYASWLATHIGPETAEMFKPGGQNAFDPIFDRFAADRGFQRSDVLAKEAEERERRSPQQGRGAAIAAFVSDRLRSR